MNYLIRMLIVGINVALVGCGTTNNSPAITWPEMPGEFTEFLTEYIAQAKKHGKSIPAAWLGRGKITTYYEENGIRGYSYAHRIYYKGQWQYTSGEWEIHFNSHIWDGLYHYDKELLAFNLFARAIHGYTVRDKMHEMPPPQADIPGSILFPNMFPQYEKYRIEYLYELFNEVWPGEME